MIAFGITPCTPETLLTVIEKRVQLVTGLGDRAFLSLWSDDWMALNPRANQFAAIRPNQFPVWQSVVDGSGFGLSQAGDIPGLTGFNASITVTVFVQNNADPESLSQQAITEFVLGVTTLVNKAAASLQGFIPRDANNNPLVREYMRMTDAGWRYTPISGKDGPWVKVPIDFEVKYGNLFPTLPDIS